MVYEEGQSTGNGNGNKMNLRLQNLEGLLQAIAGDGTTAKANSLRQVIRRNKVDMAEDTAKSLDLMRRVFQPQITDEFRQVIDRHIRTTFSPAIENLRRNGHNVAEEDLNVLARSMLDAAMETFTPIPIEKIPDIESDASDGSIISRGSLTGTPALKRRRGRPRREDEQFLHENVQLTDADLLRWNPERFNAQQRFVYATKLAENISEHVQSIFSRHPKIYRYFCTDDDKLILYEERLLAKLAPKIILLTLEDAIEIQGSVGDLTQFAFVAPDIILKKMRSRASKIFEAIRHRLGIMRAAMTQHQIQQPPPQQQQQQAQMLNQQPPQHVMMQNMPMHSQMHMHAQMHQMHMQPMYGYHPHIQRLLHGVKMAAVPRRYKVVPC